MLKQLICRLKTRHENKKTLSSDVINVEGNKITKIRKNYKCKDCGFPWHKVVNYD